MDNLKARVFAKYKCRDLGPIAHYLGIRVRRDRLCRSIELSIESYIKKLVLDYDRSRAVPRYTPLDVSVLRLKQRPDKAPEQQIKKYQTIIGKLLYPATQLRADIAFHVGFLARLISNPTLRHYDYALQIINYLNTHKNLVIAYKALEGATKLTVDMFAKASSISTSLGLYAYSDLLFTDAEDRKSTLGYLFKLASGTISYKSVKQKLVTTLIKKAKYVALNVALPATTLA